MSSPHPTDAVISELQSEQPRMSDAMKNLISIMAGQDLVPPEAAADGSSTNKNRRPHEMQHLLACAKVVLKSINAHTLVDPSTWSTDLHPQSEDESGGDRIAALTAYRACHALQAHAASHATKVTKLLGRKYLRFTHCWADGAAAEAERELSRLRFPRHTVDAFLEGFAKSIDGGDDDFAELVWARDFAEALEARRRARSKEVNERRERMQSGEDEAQALREALAAQEDTEMGTQEKAEEEEEEESRVEEVLEAV